MTKLTIPIFLLFVLFIGCNIQDSTQSPSKNGIVDAPRWNIIYTSPGVINACDSTGWITYGQYNYSDQYQIWFHVLRDIITGDGTGDSILVQVDHGGSLVLNKYYKLPVAVQWYDFIETLDTYDGDGTTKFIIYVPCDFEDGLHAQVSTRPW